MISSLDFLKGTRYENQSDFFKMHTEATEKRFMEELKIDPKNISNTDPKLINRLGVCFYGRVYSYSPPNDDILYDPELSNTIATWGNVSGDADCFPIACGWFKIAADKGNANAMFNLGICYYEGNGDDEPDQDDTDVWRAFYWFGQAAKHGQKDAIEMLKSRADFNGGKPPDTETDPSGKRWQRYDY
ncbi:MAG: hypothetical protein FWH03_06360 [Firmicutes bacterium]|nr:hypothetical protein [Bacillota bacterium]